MSQPLSTPPPTPLAARRAAPHESTLRLRLTRHHMSARAPTLGHRHEHVQRPLKVRDVPAPRRQLLPQMPRLGLGQQATVLDLG
ncbi:hypothetical protein ABZ252_00030 [Streptomyces sp. NPDC006175]|uniref:hypothetical protein n=1 Tax=Streptomyces sp. NPDC006175 TaxID=3154471 RepID=UPI00339E375F